jgi:hypothetical protein
MQDADVLDEDEQSALIQQMERAAGRSHAYSKALLCVCGTLVALLYLYFGGVQVLHPWHAMHQARFRGLLRQHAVAAADLAGACTSLLAVYACVCYPQGAWQSILAASGLMSALLAAFWGVAVFRLAVAEHVHMVRHSC